MCNTCGGYPGNKDCPECNRKRIDSKDMIMYDTDVEKALENGATIINATRLLRFDVVGPDRFRITITEVREGKETNTLSVDMPKEDLLNLHSLLPEAIKAMEEHNGFVPKCNRCNDKNEFWFQNAKTGESRRVECKHD